jgi:predicted AlkP superfamily pyrophosphatase or phosphodiesterase
VNIERVLVLGIDALEYHLVEKWNLENLQQEKYGKTELPIYSGEEPNTRIIWPCFITGRMPREMGYVTHRVFKQPLQILVNMVFPKVKFLMNPQSDDPSDAVERKTTMKSRLMSTAYRLLKQWGLVRNPTRADIGADTMFEAIPDSIHAHVPIYDEYIPPYAERTLEAIENKAYRPVFEMKCKNELNRRSSEVFRWLKNQEWQLAMQYFWCLDGIQHVFFNNEKKMAEFYLRFDEFVGKLQTRIADDTLLMVVSDHGQHKGVHTDHGFYSVNMPLELENPKLIDFKQIQYFGK